MENNKNTFRRHNGDEPDPRLDVFDQAAWDAAFDINDFDDSDIVVPNSLPDATAVFQEVQLAVDALAGTSSDVPADAADNGADFLFPGFSEPVVVQCKHRRSSLWSIVIRAYQEVRCDRSVDYIVTEPESNLLFLQRCWELGAGASPFELNWMLMNARKDHRMPCIERAKPTSLGKEVLDSVSYAADIAMRELQNDLYFKHHRETPSVDQILCDPHLVRKFDTRATRICPGYQPFHYRWAVLGLRKARRTRACVGFPTDLRPIGLVEDLRRDRLPNTSGLYWITSGTNSLFVGVANDIQRQVLSFVDRLGGNAICRGDQRADKPRLLVMENGVTHAEQYRTRLLKDKGSLLNFHLSKSLLTAA
jgi:hypothetical protein